MSRSFGAATCLISGVFVLTGMVGCTTKAGKKALNKPIEIDSYSGFGETSDERKTSDRRTKAKEVVSDDLNPEKAVEVLIDHMQRKEPHYRIPAEETLRYWATKQGVSEMIVQRIKVLMLLKHPDIEVRAPALRLMLAYGKKDSIGDIIEVLNDQEYGMRALAYKSLKTRAGRDFGYNPAGGELARQHAVDLWRGWWQDEQRTTLTRESPIPEIERTKPPKIVNRDSGEEAVPEEEPPQE